MLSWKWCPRNRRVTGKVDLKWDGNDAHVELESMASKLVSGVAIHGVGILEADDIMFDQLSISGNIVPLRGTPWTLIPKF
jgi:hypothetical protein